MLYEVVLTFKSVDKTLVCDQSNKSYWAVPLCGIVCYAEQGDLLNTYEHKVYMHVLFQDLDTWKIIHMKEWWEIQESWWYLKLVIIKNKQFFCLPVYLWDTWLADLTLSVYVCENVHCFFLKCFSSTSHVLDKQLKSWKMAKSKSCLNPLSTSWIINITSGWKCDSMISSLFINKIFLYIIIGLQNVQTALLSSSLYALQAYDYRWYLYSKMSDYHLMLISEKTGFFFNFTGHKWNS